MSAPAAHPIRLLIVDDSPLIRAGLRAVLEAHDEVTIVGEAGTATEGLAAVMQHKPDVVLLDLRLPDRPGLSACRDILARRPGTRVIILTSATDERNVHEAIAVGAHGYLLKENDGASLVAAITRVAAGHSVLDPSLADQMLNLMKRGLEPVPADRLAVLSPQERRGARADRRGPHQQGGGRAARAKRKNREKLPREHLRQAQCDPPLAGRRDVRP